MDRAAAAVQATRVWGPTGARGAFSVPFGVCFFETTEHVR